MTYPPENARTMLALAAALLAAGGVLGAQPASQPAAEAGPTLNQKAALLAKAVLADPMDAPAREQLEALRAEQRRARSTAFGMLAQGLRAYLEAGPGLAGTMLRQAASSAQAASLAKPLGKGMGQLLAAGAAPDPGRAKPCAKCGGTGLVDCAAHRCYASGWVPCGTCKGRGVLQAKAPALGRIVFYICRDCAGTGVTRCDDCTGHGTVACKACNRQPGRWAGHHLTGNKASAIEKVVCKARWLHRGGIDLYTDGALKPSPK